jgi:HSP20 family molecular chaperone IbpA
LHKISDRKTKKFPIIGRIEPLNEGKYTRRERRFGLFDRTIRLPTEVHGQKTTTMYEHGLLKITLAKVKNEDPQEKYNEEEPEATEL